MFRICFGIYCTAQFAHFEPIAFAKTCAKEKHIDDWFKLKGVDSGKIHLGLHRLDKIAKDDLVPDEPHLIVLQFYLREIEGILINSPGYEDGLQRYHAMVDVENGSVLDLGYGKVDPHEKHNFVTFDQAAYTVSICL